MNQKFLESFPQLNNTSSLNSLTLELQEILSEKEATDLIDKVREEVVSELKEDVAMIKIMRLILLAYQKEGKWFRYLLLFLAYPRESYEKLAKRVGISKQAFYFAIYRFSLKYDEVHKLMKIKGIYNKNNKKHI